MSKFDFFSSSAASLAKSSGECIPWAEDTKLIPLSEVPAQGAEGTLARVVPDLPPLTSLERLPSNLELTKPREGNGYFALRINPSSDNPVSIVEPSQELLLARYCEHRLAEARGRVYQYACDLLSELQPYGRGEVPESARVTSRFLRGDDLSPDMLALIQKQYAAFARRAGIEPTDLIYHLGNGNGVVWSPHNTQDFVVGQFIGEILAVSHFAPSSLRGGLDAMLDLLHTCTPVVFAVPQRLADQLSRVGFKESSVLVPMYFRGELQMKRVLVNQAFNPKDLYSVVKWYWAEGVISGKWDGLSNAQSFCIESNLGKN